MKLNINKDIIKRGIYLASLSLITIPLDGCSKNSESIIIEETGIDNDYEEHKLAISNHEDTQAVLKAYNGILTRKKLTVDDLEFMVDDCIYSVKLEDGNYTQINMDDYKITFDSNNKPIIYYNDFRNYNILTGEKITSDVPKTDDITIGEYVKRNDICVVAYTFQLNKSWDDKEKESIIRKYGEEVFNCVSEYGLPLRMYDAKDFYESKKVNIKK